MWQLPDFVHAPARKLAVHTCSPQPWPLRVKTPQTPNMRHHKWRKRRSHYKHTSEPRLTQPAPRASASSPSTAATAFFARATMRSTRGSLSARSRGGVVRPTGDEPGRSGAAGAAGEALGPLGPLFLNKMDSGSCASRTWTGPQHGVGKDLENKRLTTKVDYYCTYE